MDIRGLLTYSDNCIGVLRETLTAQGDVWDKGFETTGAFKSIRELTAHCVGAEQRWVEVRLLGNDGMARYESQAADSVTGVFDDWAKVRARTREVLEEALSPMHGGGLHREVSVGLSGGQGTEIFTVEEMLFHILNHQVWHLGQISMALQRFGIDPPNFDYPLLRRDKDEDE